MLDDIIVWWVADDRFDVMPNASNTSRVLAAVGGDDVTAGRTVLAVQGPSARERLAAIGAEAAAVGRFRVAAATVAGRDGDWSRVRATPVRTASRSRSTTTTPRRSSTRSLAAGVTPAGLGARDTLRLEAALPLHGHELSATITPLEAGLGWVVGWDKPAFRGRDALRRAARARVRARALRGLRRPTTRQPPRDGAVVRSRRGARSATVTSGNFSPVLERGIALALVDAAGAPSPGDARRARRARAGASTRRASTLPFVEKHG